MIKRITSRINGIKGGRPRKCDHVFETHVCSKCGSYKCRIVSAHKNNKRKRKDTVNKIILNKTGGVYTMFVDPISQKSLRKDDPNASTALVSTIVKIQEAYKAFGKDNVEIVDWDPPPSVQETVSVSDDEVNRYLGTPAIQSQTNNDLRSILMEFREGVIESKYNKSYINGMARIILLISPESKEELKVLASKKKEAKTSKDLL